jgi:hypothetical protein
VGAIFALTLGSYFLYDSYQALTWGQRAINEAGSAAYRPGVIQDRILSEAAEKDRKGEDLEHSGLILLAAGMILEGLASNCKTLQLIQERTTDPEKNRK